MRYEALARSSVIPLALVLLALPEPAVAAGVDCSDIPSTLKATYSLGSASARRGEEVTIPFSILANADLQGFSVSVDFDEDVLEAVSVDMAYRNPEGGKWAIQILGYDNNNADPTRSGSQVAQRRACLILRTGYNRAGGNGDSLKAAAAAGVLSTTRCASGCLEHRRSAGSDGHDAHDH